MTPVTVLRNPAVVSFQDGDEPQLGRIVAIALASETRSSSCSWKPFKILCNFHESICDYRQALLSIIEPWR
jgi:hypothetical protein